ncbi:MAG: hypothetical protein WBA74_02780, partial [Cyclobacteriaceae bacterium]
MKKRITILPDNFQIERKDLSLPALLPETVRINGLSVRQQLAFCADLADVIDFYNLQGKQDGQWSELLDSNLPVFTASILEKDLSGYFLDFSANYQALRADSNLHLRELFLQNFFKSVFKVFLEINDWFCQSQQQFDRNKVYQLLKEAISEKGQYLLASFYKIYFAYCESHPNLRNLGLKDFSVLDSAWKFEPFPFLTKDELLHCQALLYTAVMGKKEGEFVFIWLNELLSEINLIYKQSLEDNTIKPHIGVLLSFLDLLKHSRQNANSLTADHLNFFYRDILMLSPAAAQPDIVYLTVRPAKGVDTYVLPADTGFKAGNDGNNKPIVFESVSEVQLTSSEIMAYKTLS